VHLANGRAAAVPWRVFNLVRLVNGRARQAESAVGGIKNRFLAEVAETADVKCQLIRLR